MSGPVVVVIGLPGSGKSTLARLLAVEARLPLLSLDTVKEAVVDELDPQHRLDRFAIRRAAREVVVRQVAEQPGGCLVDVWLNPVRDESGFTERLRALPGVGFLEVVCRVPVEVAVERYAARTRHPAHLPMDRDAEDRIREAAPRIGPLGLGPHRDVDTTAPLTAEALADLVSWLGVARVPR